MAGEYFEPVVGSDPDQEKDNVVALLADRFCVGTLPPSEAIRVEIQVAAGAAVESLLGPERWDIPLAAVTELFGSSGEGFLNLVFQGEPGEVRRRSFKVGRRKVSAFFAEFERLVDDDWDVERRRDTAGGVVTLVVWCVFGLLIAAITGCFYWAIAAGWIDSAPSLIAMVVNLCGLEGLLAVGGLCVIACVLAGCKGLLLPGHYARFQRREP